MERLRIKRDMVKEYSLLKNIFLKGDSRMDQNSLDVKSIHKECIQVVWRMDSDKDKENFNGIMANHMLVIGKKERSMVKEFGQE